MKLSSIDGKLSPWAYRLLRQSMRAFPRGFRNRFADSICSDVEDRLGGTSGLGLVTGLSLECAVVVARGLALRLGHAPRIWEGAARTSGEKGDVVNDFLKDLVLGLRLLRRAPSFAAVVVLTLALGVGANAAIFSIVHTVLIEPLPYPASQELVRIWPVLESDGQPVGFSIPDFRDWRERSTTVASMGLYSTAPGDLVVQSSDGAREIETAFVSTGFFPTLGVPAVRGRYPTEEEARTNPFVAVVSERLWRAHYSEDPHLVGKVVTLSDRPFEVVGIAPTGQPVPAPDVDLWVLLGTIKPSDIPLEQRPVRLLDAVARLQPGVDREAAEAELSGVASDLSDQFPQTNGDIRTARVVNLHESIVGDVRLGLLVLLGAVAATLLIACVNVANLMLARSAGRRAEFSLRAALGATRRRLVRLVVAESLVLGALAGVVGLLAATLVTPWISRQAEGLLPRVAGAGVDLGIALQTLVLSLILGGVFGGLGVLRMGRSAAGPNALSSGSMASGVRGSTALRFGRSGLVVAEVALATLLLIAAGLMVRSLERLTSVDPGYEADGLVSMSLTFATNRYDESQAYMSFYRELKSRLESLPGVEGVATIKQLPLRGAGEKQGWSLPGDSEAAERYAYYQPVSPDVFEVMGIPLLAGDGFPSEPQRPIIVINRALAERAYGADPKASLGKTLLVGGGIEAEVVGVVGDVRSRTLLEASPATVYVPQTLMSRRVATYVVRTADNPSNLIGPMRAVVQDLDPAQAVTEIAPVSHVVRSSLQRPRLMTVVLGMFAALAATLAGIGIYGVVSYRMAQRLPELGLRKAIGASNFQLASLVLRSVFLPVALGTGLGLGASAVMTQSMKALLFETVPLDPVTYVSVVVGIAAVALLACARPTRRACALDATEVLRGN